MTTGSADWRGSVTLILGCVLAASTIQAQAPSRPEGNGLITVQSELDYLRASKLKISVELKQVTVRQIFDEIAHKAGIRIEFEGALPQETRRDASFTKARVKDVLAKLGTDLNVQYRVDGPDQLSVIGERKP